jgi:hypothetical protein
VNRYLKKKGRIKEEHKKNESLQLKSERRSKDITSSIKFWVTSARE